MPALRDLAVSADRYAAKTLGRLLQGARIKSPYGFGGAAHLPQSKGAQWFH